MSKKCIYKTETPSIKGAILSVALVCCTLNFINIAQAKHLLVYGDSLSAAYGMDLEQGWVHLVAQDLGAEHQISNASISGETTVGGLARLAQTLKELQPNVVMLELGANDGLRGYSIVSIKSNLSAMIEMVISSGARVVLAGISLPPSYGPRYIDQFRNVFQQLASEYEIDYLDFYNERFITTPGMIQIDGLHPTEAGQFIIRDTVKQFLTDQKILE